MRRQSRLALIRVETLDQRDFIWRLSAEVVPPVRRVVAHAERGPLPIGVDVPRRDEVLLRVERAPVCDGERVVRDGVRDGAPHVNDAHTTLEEAICLCGYMVSHPSNTCGIRLVNVHARLGEGVSDRVCDGTSKRHTTGPRCCGLFGWPCLIGRLSGVYKYKSPIPNARQVQRL